ncbi:hypothetical protein D3C73_1477190 [compost metagenome]
MVADFPHIPFRLAEQQCLQNGINVRLGEEGDVLADFAVNTWMNVVIPGERFL